MRKLHSIACVSLLALAACAAPDGQGYYDNTGRYVPPNAREPFEHNVTLRDRIRNEQTYGKGYDQRDYRDYREYRNYDYAGYYDINGNYIAWEDENLGVPRSMLPAPGMCRVWLPNRPTSKQPRVESCDNIRNRVPAGAYVIYGG